MNEQHRTIVKQWINDDCIICGDSVERFFAAGLGAVDCYGFSSDLYVSFKKWAERTNQYHRIGPKNFSQVLETFPGVTKKRLARGVVFLGLALRLR